MNEENRLQDNSQWESEEASIDFQTMFSALKKHWKNYVVVILASVIFGAVYTLSLPAYYECQVMLVPELSLSGSSSGSLTSLASTFGVTLGGGGSKELDAITPNLYPDLMNSVDFKGSLFDIKVHRKDSSKIMNYYDYLLYYQQKPWWINLFMGKDSIKDEKLNTFMLTKQQTRIMKTIQKNVVCDVDEKTGVITICVTDQDPLIAATMADSVQSRLQEFITKYRTNKARNDLENTKKLCMEAKHRYEKARQLYGSFSDSNQDLILESVRSKREDLENDMQLQFNTYNSLAANLQASYAKVQEVTPAFTTLQSATMPIEKAGPQGKKIVLVFAFLAFLGVTVYALWKEKQLKMLLGL